MTDTQELDDLVHRARYFGAEVIVKYDDRALADEGRRIYESIQVVSGLRHVGSFPMSPISAAETLRRALARHLHESSRLYTNRYLSPVIT